MRKDFLCLTSLSSSWLLGDLEAGLERYSTLCLSTTYLCSDCHNKLFSLPTGKKPRRKVVLMICYFNRTDSSGFVRMGLFGLTVLDFWQGKMCHWRSWKACGSFDEVHSNCYVDGFGWICILVNLCILPSFSKHCSVIPALSVVRAVLFPTWPLVVTIPFLHPACHSLVLQAGGADLEDEKSSKRYWPLLNSHSYKDFFSPCNFGMLLSETIHSLGRLWMG